jgi:hypothetical protein
MDETETETITRATKEPEYGKHDEEMNEITQEGKHEKPESANMPEQDREGGSAIGHSEKKLQIETCEETPKPPKKLRMDNLYVG